MIRGGSQQSRVGDPVIVMYKDKDKETDKKNMYKNQDKVKALDGGDAAKERRVFAFPLTSGISFIFLVLFMGILLSGAVYYGISAIMGTTELCDDYYDGGEYDHSGLYALNDVFFRDSSMRELAVKFEYILFGRIDNEDIIVGRDGFLFAADRSSGYDYVRDYIGELSSFSETEALCRAIKQRAELFSSMGVDYILAVIPNSQTVYSDKMPGYFGNISEDTRLARLSRRMALENVKFLDLTSTLCDARDAGVLYNNTENSLNALGAYYAYLAVYDAMADGSTADHAVISAEDANFIWHMTDGRTLARAAGLEKLIRNKTVSLPGDMPKKFNYLGYFSGVELTAVTKKYRDDMPTYPLVLLEFNEGDEWDKMLMYEYFSNTFGTAAYRVGNSFAGNTIKDLAPQVVVQFVRENAIGTLIDERVMESYTYTEIAVDNDTVPDDMRSAAGGK